MGLQNEFIGQQRPLLAGEGRQHAERLVSRRPEGHLIAGAGEHGGDDNALQDVEPQTRNCGQCEGPTDEYRTRPRIRLKKLLGNTVFADACVDKTYLAKIWNAKAQGHGCCNRNVAVRVARS
jgi:hypothetical protein